MSIRGVFTPLGRGLIYRPVRLVPRQDEASADVGINFGVSAPIAGLITAVTVNLAAVNDRNRVVDVTSAATMGLAAATTGVRVVDVVSAVTVNLLAADSVFPIFVATAGVGVNFAAHVSNYAVSDGVRQPSLDKSLRTWVVNAETGASSQYDDFGFTSYAVWGSSILGAGEDGIYLLDKSSTDAGVAIEATVQLPRMNFKSQMLKSVPFVWIGVASDNEVVLKVVADTETYYYTARSSDQDMREQRFDIGRGLKSVFWSFSLVANGDCEFESVIFEPIVLSRRI